MVEYVIAQQGMNTFFFSKYKIIKKLSFHYLLYIKISTTKLKNLI